MLNYGIKFADLYDADGLSNIDTLFLNYLQQKVPQLYDSLIAVRQQQDLAYQRSQLIIDLSIELEFFIAELFFIQTAVAALQNTHHSYHHLSQFKHRVIQKRILPKFNDRNWDHINESIFTAELALNDLELIRAWYDVQDITIPDHNKRRDQLETYIAWRCLHSPYQYSFSASALFARPQQLDFNRLFSYDKTDHTITLSSNDLKPRYGFDLTDSGPDPFYAYDQAYYCLKCHKTGRDSCAHGLNDKSGQIAVNPLGNTLKGCPLEQKISEMTVVKQQGYCVAALAIIVIDNPMVAATGHRICNDCEKACIFQKQTPVDVPSIETQILTDVLALPWGFEIYSLLTRWNPLNFNQYLPRRPTGYNILIAGMGPAGFTLAHYLLRLGHQVLAIDAFKIEPLPYAWWGRQANNQIAFEPVHDIAMITEPLSTRAAYGFGGVAEYGITSRWNKNFLTVIRLILMRHTKFRLQGHTRLGSNLTISSARKLGFDHVALCLGSGKPHMPWQPHILAKGIRAASDFLMNLQASGAARDNSLTNLQIRLPIVVIGGGLTAIDAATEALAYYQHQVGQFLQRYEQLSTQTNTQTISDDWSDAEQEIAQEFIAHARWLRQLHAQGDHGKAIAALQAWGGVQILYRGTLQQAPAYTTNAREIKQALDQGIVFVENTVLQEIVTDTSGAIKTIKVDQAGKSKTLSVRTLLFATGISPNTYYSHEHPADINQTSFHVQDHDPHRPFIQNAVAPGYVSAFGDLAPQYSGSVVKAMASAKHGYLKIDTILKRYAPLTTSTMQLLNSTQQQLQSHIVDNVKLSDELTKLIIKSPLAAHQYRVGQFYKLQNFEKTNKANQNVELVMRGVALTPVHVDKNNGLITFIIRILGASTAYISNLQVGDQVALMGPTGAALSICNHQNTLIVADDFYGLALLPIIEALIQMHNYIHVYLNSAQHSDTTSFQAMLPNNKFITVHSNKADVAKILSQFDRIIVSGTPIQLQNLQILLAINGSNNIKATCQIYTSINAPMQCMMKEICAQCIQQKIDPESGELSYFYACAQQWQPLAAVDLDILQNRLEQNSLMVKLNYAWLQHTGQIMNVNTVQKMVGTTGIEPVTPMMST